MELLEDYDFELQYHPGKANVVTDALSHRSHLEIASLLCKKWEMMDDLIEFDLEPIEGQDGAVLSAISAQPVLFQRMIEAQLDDAKSRRILPKVLSETGLDGWRVGADQGLLYRDRLFVQASCRDDVLRNFHHSRFAVHPGDNKMY